MIVKGLRLFFLFFFCHFNPYLSLFFHRVFTTTEAIHGVAKWQVNVAAVKLHPKRSENGNLLFREEHIGRSLTFFF